MESDPAAQTLKISGDEPMMEVPSLSLILAGHGYCCAIPMCASEWYTNREWFYGIFILYMLVLCIKTAILCNFIRQKWGKNAIEMTKNLLAKIRWHLHPDDCIDSRNSGNRWFLYYLWTLLGVSRLLIGMLSYQISNCFQDS